MSSDRSISVVAPCYEEAGHLRVVVNTLLEALAIASPADFELILVSSLAATDGTVQLAEELASGNKNLRLVLQPESDPGYGRALAMGIKAARYGWLLLTDTDGQFDHGQLARFTAFMDEARAVFGFRHPRADPLVRRATGRFYTGLVCRLLRLPRVRDLDCAFKLVHIDAMGRESLNSRTGVINAEILRRLTSRGYQVVEVPVTHFERRGGSARFELGAGALGHFPHPLEMGSMMIDVAHLLRSGG